MSSSSRPADANRLEPDREALGLFIELMFKRASPDGFISLRLFPDKGSQQDKPIDIEAIRVGDKDLLNIAVIRAGQAATWHEPAVFCPPVATFKNRKGAKVADLCEGPCLSVECDQSPRAARSTLEALLNPATAVVASGGEWTNGETGEIEPKVHLHWRLKKPARTEEEHGLLREARELATRLVGGDGTNIAIVHPIRWPGSWHRKKTPRLARIVASSDNEIDLTEALMRLRDAAGTLDFGSSGVKASGDLEAADHATVAAALAVIPNDKLEWDDWNRVGMATWAATGGSEVGREAFAAWSAKSAKNDPGATEARWQHYKTSAPTKVGFGTLIYLARKHSPGWIYGGKPAESGVSLDDFVAYMPTHGYIFTPTREFWAASSVNARVPPVPRVYSDGRPVLDEDGEQKLQRANDWLDQNRPVEQMTWSPGDPMMIEGKLVNDGGWIERPDCRTFNLYLPPRIEPGNAAEAERWLELIYKVFGDNDKHIIRWLAHRVQRPHEKINHALFLGGAQGIGKDTMLAPEVYAVGPWNFKEVSPSQAMGRFNGFLKSVVLRVSEARDSGDVDRYKFYDHMKAYIAAPPDVLRVDEKNLREHAIINVTGVIITSNHLHGGIYLPPDDRRHFVAWSSLTKDDFVEKYWERLWQWYGSGGIRHVASYLSEQNLSGFDPKAPPPKTEAFWSIVNSSRAPENAELADILDALKRPDVTTLAQLRLKADESLTEWLDDRKNRRVVGHRLEECGYLRINNDTADDGLWVIGKKRQTVYARKDLSVSEALAAARNLK